MTSSLLAVRKGSQRPRLEHVPLWVTSAADDAIDFNAEVCGLVLDDWQEYVLRNALGEREGGRWSAFEVGLVVPRQNGKNIVLEARELAGMFLFGERLIIHSAHEASTANEAFKDLKHRFQSNPDLLAEVRGFREDVEPDRFGGFKLGNNDRSIELKDGRRIVYKTRTSGGGRGLSGDLVVLDEAYALKHDHISALMPTMAARTQSGNPQLWYTSSAGMVDSEVLRQVRHRYSTGEGAALLAGFEWSADVSDLDSDGRDVEAAYVANPSLGTHIGIEYVIDTERAAFTSGESEGGIEAWRRERLGIWPEVSGEQVFPNWSACADEVLVEARVNNQPVDQNLSAVSFAVDVPPDRSSASILACGSRVDGSFFVELVDRRDGTEWVAEALRGFVERQAARGSKAGVFALGSGAVRGLEDDFRRFRLRVVFVGDREYAAGCGGFFDLVEQGLIAHSSQPELNAAVEAAKKKVVGDSLWKIVRTSTVADISPLVCAVLAVVGSRKRKPSSDKSRRRGTIFA